MNLSLRRIFSFCAALLVATACSKSSQHPGDYNLEERVKALRGSSKHEACDSLNEPKLLEIARALDQRSGAISRYLSTLPASDSFRRINIGPLVMREPIEIEPAREGWQSEIISWDRLYQNYLSTKESATDAFWAGLADKAYQLLERDENRLLFNLNVFINHQTAPLVARGLKQIDRIISDKVPPHMALEADVKSLFVNNPFYQDSFMRFEANADLSALDDLKKQLQTDNDVFGFRKNESLTSDSGKLYVDLALGPFQGLEDKIASLIETVWRGKTQTKLKVRWVQPEYSLSAYKIEVGTEVNRAYVIHENRVLHLGNDIPVHALAHEVGHILGFADQYYVVWQPNRCEYVFESNEKDIMSDDILGTVTAEEWQKLETEYHLTAPTTLP